MHRVVSQAELDTLLAPAPAAAPAVVAYDFRRPDRVSAPQLRAIQLLHESFATDAATWLSAFLRTTTELRLAEADQLAFGEFIGSLPEFTTAYALAMTPIEGFATLTLGPEVSFAMVDRILGGLGTTAPPERPLTEIEQHVVDSVVKILIDQLTTAWRSVGAQFTIHSRDTRPVMLQVTRPNDIVVLLSFTLQVGDVTGDLRLCIPAATFEGVGDAFGKSTPATPRQRTEEQSAWLYANLERVPLPVTAQLATTLAARDLMDLAPGVVLSLGHQSNQPVTVSVGHVPAYVGHVVVHNGSLAIRVDGEPSETDPSQEQP